MGRRNVSPGRSILPDPKYNSPVVAKFIGRMMLHGKKATITRTMYDAMAILQQKTNEDALQVFLKALENVKPAVEVKSRRVGGSTYQVPVEVRESRREALAMRWIIQAARARTGRAMSDCLGTELMDAYNKTGTAYKKMEDTHRMAEANKAFSHYKW